MSAAELTIITSGNAKQSFQNAGCAIWDILPQSEARENHVCHFCCQKLLVFPKSWQMGLEMRQRPNGSCWRASCTSSASFSWSQLFHAAKPAPAGRMATGPQHRTSQWGTLEPSSLALLNSQEGLGSGPWEEGSSCAAEFLCGGEQQGLAPCPATSEPSVTAW